MFNVQGSRFKAQAGVVSAFNSAPGTLSLELGTLDRGGEIAVTATGTGLRA
jgi:hypothetical protein